MGLRRCEIGLRSMLTLFVIGFSLMSHGWAQRRNPSPPKRTSPTALTMQTQSSGSVSVAITTVPDGAPLTQGTPERQSLDLGNVSYGAGARVANVQVKKLADRFVVSTRFGLNIQDPSRRFSTAAVLASIAYPESVHAIWVDNVKLAMAPQIIQAQARLGLSLEHRLLIEVPAWSTEKDSQFHNAVIFQIIPN
jgi:hypothetical protein